ncbi:MAG: putative 4-mercaptohistidine N1-methyltransferase [Verrucomicrobia bacterium]|nr:putative 4-mercaptohistidine N1-methyltransferase [Verrucomicrobiota bacterium]
MSAYYESSRGVSEYLLFHFGAPENIFEFPEFAFPEWTSYPKRCVQLGFSRERLNPQPGKPSRALDLGCAVGASTFELAKYHDEVIGIDFSQAFIDAAQKLQKLGHVEFDIPVEGQITRRTSAHIPSDIDRSKIRFEQGDATQLRSNIGKFDTIFAGNLIDRLPDPEKFLVSLENLAQPGAQLILTSPYTWLQKYTPQEKWLTTQNQHTFESIHQILNPGFDLVQSLNIPFLLREHRRKFQLTLAQASIWIRKVELNR